MAVQFKRDGVGNFFDLIEDYDKEARASGLTLRERVDGFLNTTGRKYTTLKTISEKGKVLNWKPDAYARIAIFMWLEGWYNPHRRHSGHGYLSPTNYARKMLNDAAWGSNLVPQETA